MARRLKDHGAPTRREHKAPQKPEVDQDPAATVSVADNTEEREGQLALSSSLHLVIPSNASSTVSDRFEIDAVAAATGAVATIGSTKPRAPANRRRPSKAIARRPRRQGDGDALCGFYTVINALRLTLEPFGGLNRTHEALIWAGMIRYADRNWRFASLFLNGTEPRQLLGLARLGSSLATKVTGIHIGVRQLTRHDLAAAGHQLDSVIRLLGDNGCRSILAGIESAWFSHWTVVTGVSSTTLRVLDSDGNHYLKLKGCALDAKPRPKVKPRYWVSIYGAIVIRTTRPRVKAKPNRSVVPRRSPAPSQSASPQSQNSTSKGNVNGQ